MHVYCLPVQNKIHIAIFIICAILLTAPLIVYAQWEPPLSVEGGMLPYNNARGLAVGEHGLLHVVSGGYPGDIYYTRSTNYGTVWSSMQQLSSNVGGWTNCPAIAAVGQYVHAVWEDADGSLYYRRSTNGGAQWLNQINLSGQTPWAHMPSIAVSGSNVHVIWADRRYVGGPGVWLIFYRRSTDNGATWLNGDSLCTARTSADEDPRPSISASGDDVYVTWQDFRDLYISQEIYFMRSTNNGAAWSPCRRLTFGAFSYYYMPKATLASSGSNVHIVWEDAFGDTTWMYQYLYYIRSTDQGVTWSSWVRLSPDTLFTELTTVTAMGSMVYAACYAYAPSQLRNGLFYRRSTDNGVTWFKDTLFLLPPNCSGYFYPSIAVSTADTLIHLASNSDLEGIAYFRCGSPPIGIESKNGLPSVNLSEQYRVFPNPFISFATIPGHEHERFALYDVSGRQVGAFRGDRIGEGLLPGVYFLRSENCDENAGRIVKMR